MTKQNAILKALRNADGALRAYVAAANNVAAATQEVVASGAGYLGNTPLSHLAAQTAMRDAWKAERAYYEADIALAKTLGDQD